MSIIYEYQGSQGGTWQGADNVFIGTNDPAEYNSIYGDVTEYLMESAQGGDDTLTGGASYFNTLYGDAWWFKGAAQGGDDTLTGGTSVYNMLLGDAWRISDAAQGGDDTLTGGASVYNTLYGDATYISGTGQGGDDTLTGGDGSTYNYLYGDGGMTTGEFLCGDDTLVGADGAIWNWLHGDAFSLGGSVVGGDDVLIAGDDSTNYLWGDARRMTGDAVAGDDVLVSGTGVDHMWGDAAEYYSSDVQRGSDTFVFLEDNGTDTIYDFEQGKDVIDLTALNLSAPGHLPLDKLPPQGLNGLEKAPPWKFDFDLLDSNGNDYLDDGDDCVSYANGGLDTVIDIGAAAGGSAGEDTVTIVSVIDLVVDDFLF